MAPVAGILTWDLGVLLRIRNAEMKLSRRAEG